MLSLVLISHHLFFTREEFSVLLLLSWDSKTKHLLIVSSLYVFFCSYWSLVLYQIHMILFGYSHIFNKKERKDEREKVSTSWFFPKKMPPNGQWSRDASEDGLMRIRRRSTRIRRRSKHVRKGSLRVKRRSTRVRGRSTRVRRGSTRVREGSTSVRGGSTISSRLVLASR